MTCSESPDATLIAEKTCLAARVPALAALNTPDSVTAKLLTKEKVATSCAVSLVVSVLTRDAVPEALDHPPVVISV